MTSSLLLLSQLFYKLRNMTKPSFLIPTLWFDDNAYEAMMFYADIFQNSEIIEQNPVVTRANLSGIEFIGINGGPQFKPNPSISFMVICETKAEVDEIWNKLAVNGTIHMPLQSYPWSEYYGWIGDKYGYTWQLYLGKLTDVNNQKIVPTLMFAEKQQGKCQQALDFYANLLRDFQSQGILRYHEGEMKGQIQHTQFTANGFTLMAMDSGIPQLYTFNEAVSFTILCKSQEEIDYYWNSITRNGAESMCGWCKDEFGVSWQVVPNDMSDLLKNRRAGERLMQMKKIIVEDLRNA